MEEREVNEWVTLSGCAAWDETERETTYQSKE